jgi:hypothetical protein
VVGRLAANALADDVERLGIDVEQVEAAATGRLTQRPQRAQRFAEAEAWDRPYGPLKDDWRIFDTSTARTAAPTPPLRSSAFSAASAYVLKALASCLTNTRRRRS